MGDVTEFFESTGISNVAEAAAPIAATIAVPGVGGAIAGMTGISATAANVLAGAGMAAATGGDPLMGAVGQIIPSIGGDLGELLNSDIGKAIVGKWVGGGGDLGNIQGLLNNLGITGKSKDILETVLASVAMAAVGDWLAEDAIAKAEELENLEYDAIKSMNEQAQKFADPQYVEQQVQEAREQVHKAYVGQQRELETSLGARGLANKMAGSQAALLDAEAREELAARRDIEQQAPINAMQAQSYALGPTQNAAERWRQTATDEANLPFDIYQAYMDANRYSPVDEYYNSLLAGTGQSAGSYSLPDIDFDLSGLGMGSGDFGVDLDLSGLGIGDGTSGTYIPEGDDLGIDFGMDDPYNSEIPDLNVWRTAGKKKNKLAGVY